MDKGRSILLSFGFFLLVISFVEIEISTQINIALTVFVTILTIYDLINDRFGFIDEIVVENPSLKEKYFITCVKLVNEIVYLLKGFAEFFLIFSIPTAFIISWYYTESLTKTELDQIAQSLNLYTLGILILYIGTENLFNKKNNYTSANS